MALLTNTKRKKLQAEFMSVLSGRREELALTKPELQAVLIDIDGWVDNNQAALHALMPPSLTKKQKAELSLIVFQARFEDV